MAVSLREVLCFGRYEPLFRVAAGGMAEVYAARIQGEAGFQKLVAVKRMLPHLASEPGFVDMFLNEAKLAAHIASPHVVQTLDLGRGSDGSLYIVMELVVGLSLARLMEGHPGPLPLPIALELMAQAAQGLDDAHEAETPAGEALGLIHRDVSPHNILVGLDGRARVTDFGIARAVHRPRPETNIRELKGKFAYMSPEQTRLRALDRRSDVFSLGIVLWEVLAGTRLFVQRDPMEAIRLVQRKPVPSPSELRPDVPEGLSHVVLRALERDPQKRFQTAGELALAIRRAARDAYGEPPHRKEIAAFVERGGGEELERLQRLIRLGTEGAEADAIEAVQPGVTRVLADDLSGVAPVGTGARRTAVLDPEEELEGPPTLMLSTEEPPADTGTARILRSAEVETAMFEDRGAPVEERTSLVHAPSEPPTAERPRELVGEEPTAERVALPVSQAPTSAAARPSAATRATWIAAIAVLAALPFGVGLALVFLWPSAQESAVLPVSSPTHGLVVHGPIAPSAVDPGPAPDTAVSSAGAAEVEVDPPLDGEAPSAEPEAPSAEHARAHRTRTRRHRNARSEAPPPPAEPAPSRGSAPLLGVQDFDRRPR